MIRVNAVNLKTGTSGWSDHATQELADAWIQKQKDDKSYGRGEVTLTSFEAGLAGLDIADATPAGLNEQSVELYTFPAEYQFTTTDVTAEYQKAAGLQSVLTDEDKGRKIGSEISLLLRTKLVTAQITLQQLSDFVESEEVKKVERYLDKGYLTLVVPIIQSGTFPLLTTEEKNAFLAKIQS